MRIAFLLNSFPEISERFLLNQIIGSIDAGLDITILAAHRPENGFRHELYDKYSIERYVKYADIPKSFVQRFLNFVCPGLVILVTNPFAFFEALKFWKYSIATKNLKLFYFYKLLHNENSYDILHCHFGPNGIIGSYLKHCGITKRLIVTYHGSDINTYPKRYGLTIYKHVYKAADCITANTSFTKNKIIDNGCLAEKIQVVPVGLLLSEFPPYDRTGVIENSVLTVGRLEEKKGHRYALEAIALLKNDVTNIHYYIVGDGSLRNKLQDLCEELKITSHVTFLGSLTADNVFEWYKKCQVFTLPSVTAKNGDMEGQGLVLQEAQLCMMPVVSTWHNGIPDGVLDGQTGCLVPEKDSLSLSKSILQLMSHPELMKNIGMKGRDFVTKKYNITLIVDRFIEIYKRVLA